MSDHSLNKQWSAYLPTRWWRQKFVSVEVGMKERVAAVQLLSNYCAKETKVSVQSNSSPPNQSAFDLHKSSTSSYVQLGFGGLHRSTFAVVENLSQTQDNKSNVGPGHLRVNVE